MSQPAKRLKWYAVIAKAPWRLIGIALLVIVLVSIDRDAVLAQFSRLGPVPIALAAGAFLLLLLGRFWRWRALTHAVGTREPLSASIASCNRSIWLGLATPGRVGEFRRAADLSVARGWGLAASTWLVLVDLLVDLGVYVAVALAGILFLLVPGWGAAASAVILAVAVLVLLSLGRIAGGAGRLIPAILRVPGLGELMPALRQGVRVGPALQVLGATMVAGAGNVLAVWFLVQPMQPDLGIVDVGTGVGIAGVAGAVPITYFGLGTRDVVLISFFGQIGRPAEQAIALSFCFLLVQLIGIFVSLAIGPLIDLAGRRPPSQRESGR